MTASQNPWRELARRESAGLDITLQWDRTSGAVRVVVDDPKEDRTHVGIVPRAHALQAFQHPFRYLNA